MPNKDPKIATTNISFIGDSVHKTLSAHQDVVSAIWDLCSGMLDATIKVHVFPRTTDNEKLTWNLIISSPIGRRNITANQRRPGNPIQFANE